MQMPHHPQQVEQAVLSCWKDIAQYMGKGVRTVQRWEQELALPVRRPHGRIGSKGPVTAHRADLDEWLKRNWLERKESGSQQVTAGARSKDPRALIETSRQLHARNRMLVAGLAGTIEKLRLTCSGIESIGTKSSRCSSGDN
jgi:hypothetical protein